MGHSALTVSLETSTHGCMVKGGNNSTEQRQEYVNSGAGGSKTPQQNQILPPTRIKKRVQISPDTVEPRIIFPSQTRTALRVPSCGCLFLDSLLKNSMSGHP